MTGRIHFGPNGHIEKILKPAIKTVRRGTMFTIREVQLDHRS